MKHGIYYAFWENEWNADFRYYIEKAAKIGFDVLEIAAHHINAYSAQQLTEIRQCAKDNGIILTAGIGRRRKRTCHRLTLRCAKQATPSSARR